MTPDQAIDAHLAAFALHGFAAATLDRVAREADVAPAELAAAIAGRWAAVDRFNRRLDLAALAGMAPDPTASTRDRLFDLVMARLDAARPHRDACAVLARDARTRPVLALALVAQLGRTANTLLSAADVRTTGARGIARLNAFAAILADVGRVWLTDDDPDMGATMRRLDQRLGQAENCARGRFWPGGDEPAAEPDDTAAAAI